MDRFALTTILKWHKFIQEVQQVKMYYLLLIDIPIQFPRLSEALEQFDHAAVTLWERMKEITESYILPEFRYEFKFTNGGEIVVESCTLEDFERDERGNALIRKLAQNYDTLFKMNRYIYIDLTMTEM